MPNSFFFEYFQNFMPVNSVECFLDIHHVNVSILNSNDLFSKTIPFEWRTIVEPSLVSDGRHWITMAIDGPAGKVKTIGELH